LRKCAFRFTDIARLKTRNALAAAAFCAGVHVAVAAEAAGVATEPGVAREDAVAASSTPSIKAAITV
jgi:hypothetical protein